MAASISSSSSTAAITTARTAATQVGASAERDRAALTAAERASDCVADWAPVVATMGPRLSAERGKVALTATERAADCFADCAPEVSIMGPRVEGLYAHLDKLSAALSTGDSSKIATLYSQLRPDVQKSLEEREQAIIFSRGLTIWEQIELRHEIQYYAVRGLANALKYVPDMFFCGMQSLKPLLKPLNMTSSGIPKYLHGCISSVEGNVPTWQHARTVIFEDPNHYDLDLRMDMNIAIGALFRDGDVLLLEGVIRGATPCSRVRRQVWPVADEMQKERGGAIQGWDCMGSISMNPCRENTETADAKYQAAREACERAERKTCNWFRGTGSARQRMEARKKAALGWMNRNKVILFDRNASMVKAVKPFYESCPEKRIFVIAGASHGVDPQLPGLGTLIKITFRRKEMGGFKKGRLSLPPRAGGSGLTSSSSSSSTSSRGSLPALPAGGPPPAYPSFSSTPAATTTTPAPTPVAAVIPPAPVL